MYAHLRNLGNLGLGGWVVCAHLRNTCGWLGTRCWHDRIDTGCNPLRSRVAVAADEVATKSIKFTMILQQRICNKTNCNAGDTRGYKTWGVRFAYQTIGSCYFSKRLSLYLSVMDLTLLSCESRGHVEVAGGLSSFSTKSFVVEATSCGRHWLIENIAVRRSTRTACKAKSSAHKQFKS